MMDTSNRIAELTRLVKGLWKYFLELDAELDKQNRSACGVTGEMDLLGMEERLRLGEVRHCVLVDWRSARRELFDLRFGAQEDAA